MSAIEGRGFRSLEQYKAQFPERVTEPETLDPETIYTLLSRAMNAPVHMGAYANLAKIREVEKTSTGLYAVQFVILHDNLKENGRLDGEFFDGLWNSHGSLNVLLGNGSRVFPLVDGFVTEKRLPKDEQRHVDVSLEVPHARELVGV